MAMWKPDEVFYKYFIVAYKKDGTRVHLMFDSDRFVPYKKGATKLELMDEVNGALELFSEEAYKYIRENDLKGMTFYANQYDAENHEKVYAKLAIKNIPMGKNEEAQA